MGSEISVVRCMHYNSESVYRSVKKALDYIGGMPRYVKPGDKVLIKPNMLSSRNPEKAVTTHPEIIRAVIRLVRESNATPYVGDSPGGSITRREPQQIFKDIETLWKETGIKRVCDEELVQLVTFEKGGVETVKVPGRKCTPVLNISKTALGFDAIINMPKLKTHMLTMYTGAIKNMYGCIPGMRKTRYHAQAIHPEDFAEMLVDILEYVKPGLTIMDGVLAMDSNGPQAGRVINTGVIIAGTDCVAIDSAGATILTFKPGTIPAIRIAHKRGLGELDLTKVKVHGEKIENVIFKNAIKPSNMPGNFLAITPKFMTKFIDRFITSYPFILKDKCQLCLECVKSCPQGAIKMVKGTPFVRKNMCITCMCCHELCKYEAIAVKPNNVIGFITWLRNK